MSIWVNRFWNSLGFLDLDICFLPQIREIFGHISSDSFSGPFSLSSSSEIHIMQMLFCLMLSQWFLKLISLFKILLFILLLCLDEFSCFVLQLTDSLLHPVYCWTPLVYFSIEIFQLKYLPTSLVLSYISIPVEALTVFIHSPPEFGEHLYHQEATN